MAEVLAGRDGAAAVLRLNRPQQLNALTPQLVDELAAALDAAETDPAVRAVVIGGAGTAFCAGADLNFAGDHAGHCAVSAFLERLGAVFGRLESFPKPTIAAVNGVSVGGGLELALCCDLIVAAASARLGDGHSVYGFVPGGGASVRLPRRVGLGQAKYLMFTGLLRPAGELAACGLVDEVVPDAGLNARVAEIVALLSRRSPLGLARMKRLLHDGLEQSPAAALRAELAISDLHRRSADNREGVRAFQQKQAPLFTGT